jgi:hypothetical protein
MTSVLSRISSDRQKAAAICMAAKLPLDLCAQTGNSSLQVELYDRSSYGMNVTHASEENGKYLVTIALSCVRGPDGYAAEFGKYQSALKRSQDNPKNAAQWHQLTAKVMLSEEDAPEGMLAGLAKYHAEADELQLDMETRRQEYSVWFHGEVKFTIQRGGQFGLYIDQIDLETVTWEGKGSNKHGKYVTLSHESVEDVSDLFATTVESQTVTRQSRRQRKAAVKA